MRRRIRRLGWSLSSAVEVLALLVFTLFLTPAFFRRLVFALFFVVLFAVMFGRS
jgi:hypothetical protein